MKFAQIHGLNNVWCGIWDLEVELLKIQVREKLRATAGMLFLASAELRYDKMALPASTRLDELLELIEKTAKVIEEETHNE